MVSAQAKFCNNCGRPMDRQGFVCSRCRKETEEKRMKKLQGYRAAYSRAKRDALKRLSEAHPAQYQQLLEEELLANNATSVEAYEAHQRNSARAKPDTGG